MTRAARNVGTIIERLGNHGYAFGDTENPAGATVPHSPPDAQTPAFVGWLEKRFGPVPLTVKAWIEIVGDVSLLGTHPDWPDDIIADPLAVEVEYKSWEFTGGRDAVRASFENEYEDWSASVPDGDASPFVLTVAPDALHKAHISGGSPYGFVLPDPGADATFQYDDYILLPFIEYLRLAFQHGGFPGVVSRGPVPIAEWCQRELAAGLLPL